VPTQVDEQMARRGPITFVGRSQADAKRKALNFWYMNQEMLQLSIRDFSACLALLPDGKTIAFSPHLLRKG